MLSDDFAGKASHHLYSIIVTASTAGFLKLMLCSAYHDAGPKMRIWSFGASTYCGMVLELSLLMPFWVQA
jgi:hypothetical protein